MASPSLLRFLIAGQLARNYILTPQNKALLDVPGGSLFYAAAGLAIWEPEGIGLIGRVGEDYPQNWLWEASRRGFDTRGIHTIPETLDLRHFVAYTDGDTAVTDNPVAHFAQLGLPFPKTLLGYTPPATQGDSRLRSTPRTIRQSDMPEEYLDATAAHICPMDLLSHTLLPPLLRGGNINTITLDPGQSYMTPTFWDEIPVLLNGISAFLCSEQKLRSLFHGRSEDLWEMAETLSGYGCETIVIKRGSQGQYLYNGANRTRWMIPAYPVQQVADPTGSGDAFCGGFLSGYRTSYEPLEAILAGNVSAAISLEGEHPFYPLEALPGLAKARVGALREMVRKI
jgi:sugar/nucleoside kinase (ribokinase family)